MTDKPTCDIVVPIFGQIPLVDRCISTLPSTTGVSYTLTLIDDCSPNRDEMRRYLQTKSREAKLMHNFQNLGFGQTVNKAARATFSRYLVVLNSDTVPLPGWLDMLVEAAERNPKNGVVGALLLFDPESPHGPGGLVQHAGMTFNVNLQPLHRFIGWRPDHPRVRQFRDDLQAVTGACMLVRRSVWNEVGGFAKEYGKGTFEDIELSIQAKWRGYNICYQPDAMLYHRVGASAEAAGGFPVQANYHLFLNRVGGITEYDQWKVL